MLPLLSGVQSRGKYDEMEKCDDMESVMRWKAFGGKRENREGKGVGGC